MIYLGLGSNLGDRSANLARARSSLAPGFNVTRESPIYETAPWGFTDQPDYLNQVLEGTSELGPADLLRHIKSIEASLGRRATFRYGPRVIDIDILLYDDRVINLPGLQVPHPRLKERAFILAPLQDLAPDLVPPQYGQTVTEILEALQVPAGAVRRYRQPAELPAESLELAGKVFRWGSRTYLMGIINVTPDSFSGDGLLGEQDPVAASLRQARSFLDQGADILDVGGQSTRPGSTAVGPNVEIDRVLPVIRALASELKAVISIDTYHHQVALAALDQGAHLVNDVWGLRADPEMAAALAQRGSPAILMHNRLTPNSAELAERLGGRYVGVEYEDLLGDIQQELLSSVSIALEAGIAREKIILDPGIGFGKTTEQNLELLNRTGEIRALGYPVLIGPSRKSFIGYTLDLPPDQRLEGTAAAVAIGIARGADIVRVHDVAEMARVARMTDALVRR